MFSEYINKQISSVYWIENIEEPSHQHGNYSYILNFF